MQVISFPGSCTTKLATGFDEFNGTGVGNDGWGVEDCVDEDQTQAWVINAIADAKEKGNATLVFATTSKQDIINRVLLKLGIGHSPWMTKTRYTDREIRIWYVDLMRWTENDIDDNADRAEEE